MPSAGQTPLSPLCSHLSADFQRGPQAPVDLQSSVTRHLNEECSVMRSLCLLLSWLCLLVNGQFRQFQRPTNTNHDLLKQIVKSTPDDLERLGDRYPGDRRTSILDRARFRPKSLRRPFERKLSPRLSPTRAQSSDCEELRAENELLKQLVDKLTKQLEASEVRAQQASPVTSLSPLSLISEALKTRLGLAQVSNNGLTPFLPGINERGIRRVVSQGEPVTSTLLITTSYESLVTSSVTRDISILFQGRYSTTHVLDSVIEVNRKIGLSRKIICHFQLQTSTITDTITSLVEITPTVAHPALQANTITSNLLNKLQRENIQEKDRNFSAVRLITTTTEKPEGLDSFETLKGYLSRIKNKTRKPLRAPFKRPALRQNQVTTEESAIKEDNRHEGEKEEEEVQNNYRANLFGRRNLLKQKISSSIYMTEEASIEPTVTQVTPSEEVIIEPSVTESSLVVNVASNVRVEGEGEGGDLRTSVVTVFLSGKVPGVFSTSLKTVILTGEEEAGRARREAAEILPTRRLDIPHMTDDYWHLIESSINS